MQSALHCQSTYQNTTVFRRYLLYNAILWCAWVTLLIHEVVTWHVNGNTTPTDGSATPYQPHSDARDSRPVLASHLPVVLTAAHRCRSRLFPSAHSETAFAGLPPRNDCKHFHCLDAGYGRSSFNTYAPNVTLNLHDLKSYFIKKTLCRWHTT
jgi:hypothetical protein